MRIFIVMSAFLFGGLVHANPLVTQSTDVGKRSVKSHHQVTRCAVGDDYCTRNTVTEFKKPMNKTVYYGDCNYVDDGKKTYQHCKLTKKKKKVKTVVKTKVVDTTKNNRLQLHVGYGSDGLEVNETNNDTSVKEKRKVIFGAQYTRRLNQDFNLGASVFTNKTATLTFGIDY